MFRRVALLVATIGVFAFCTSTAEASTITFESLSELEVVTTQFAGLSFTNATVLTAGSSVNENEFPPRSGVNVIFDDGAPIRIDFVSPVISFGGYFTYLVPITLSAFDANNNLLGSVSSSVAYFSNLAISGDPGSSPNEFLQLAFANMAYVTIAGDPFGGSFVADDLEITAAVPEPGTLALFGIGVCAIAVARRRFRNIG